MYEREGINGDEMKRKHIAHFCGKEASDNQSGFRLAN
jgi:hypothetical protein